MFYQRWEPVQSNNFLFVYRKHLKLGRCKLHELQKIFTGVRLKPLKMLLTVIADISYKCKILLRDIFFPRHTPVRLVLLNVSISCQKLLEVE